MPDAPIYSHTLTTDQQAWFFFFVKKKEKEIFPFRWHVPLLAIGHWPSVAPPSTSLRVFNLNLNLKVTVRVPLSRFITQLQVVLQGRPLSLVS